MLRLFPKVAIIFILFILLSSKLGLSENEPYPIGNVNVPFLSTQTQWVDSIMDTLTLEQKVTQLFMIAVYSDKNNWYEQQIINQIEKYQIGGIIFMQGGPVRQAILSNKLQSVVQIPLMVGIDAEHGLAMRLDSTTEFPKSMAIGAIRNDQYAFNLGAEIAQQCNRLNIHINFAPVVDINSNPNNPIINVRSFGEEKSVVASKGLAYAMGLQSKRVLAVAKHFPGHGDTNKDSHKTLPEINHDKKRMEDVELYPFKTLINNGVGGVMVAHLSVSSLNNGSNTPVSLSASVSDTLLKQKLGFKGLVFTDALNMKGVTRDFSPGEIEIKAILAGNDVLLFPEKVDIALQAVINAVNNGTIPESVINNRCRKILMAKLWFGLDHYRPIDTANLYNDLNSVSAEKLKNELIEKSITQIAGNNTIVPLKHLQDKRIIAISIGNDFGVFKQTLQKYSKVDTVSLTTSFELNIADTLLEKLNDYDVLIISKHDVTNSPYNHYGVTTSEIEFIKQASAKLPVVLAWFGSPYGLKPIVESCKLNTIMLGYSNFKETNSLLAQAIFGGIKVDGILPVTISQNYPVGLGSITNEAIRLKYALPSEFGLSDTAFNKVDSIIQQALQIKAMPGCQVLYAVNGKVIYSKCFGYSDYENNDPVVDSKIYDIASVTKVAATTMAIMHLYEQKQINLTTKLSNYLPQLKHTNKKNIRIDDIMAHQARLKSWIPFYKNTLDEKGNLRESIYSKQQQLGFDIKVCDDLFLRTNYVDSIYKAIVDTPIYRSKKYRYSDLGFYYLAQLINELSGSQIDKLTDSLFYSPLGMNYTTYKPLQKFCKSQIMPTENDEYFRHTIIQGYVHDPGAAMLGGVSGHAGVFSTANDLAKLGQMLLNNGIYGGNTYLRPQTLSVFNTSRFKRKDNRRGLGFDKPALKVGDPGPTCHSASHSSFGHSGFTGAYFWVDPQNQSIFIFLSNRTYPNQNNNKLVDYNIRTEIHQEFYNVLEHINL